MSGKETNEGGTTFFYGSKVEIQTISKFLLLQKWKLQRFNRLD